MITWYDVCPDNKEVFVQTYISFIPLKTYIHYKVWDEITYPFPIFNRAAADLW